MNTRTRNIFLTVAGVVAISILVLPPLFWFLAWSRDYQQAERLHDGVRKGKGTGSHLKTRQLGGSFVGDPKNHFL
jgi:hypothetical protein